MQIPRQTPKIRTHFSIKIQLLFFRLFFNLSETPKNGKTPIAKTSILATLEQPLKTHRKSLKNQSKIIENSFAETLYK